MRNVFIILLFFNSASAQQLTRVPLVIELPSYTQLQEDSIATKLLSKGLNNKMQIWNTTLGKTRLWNVSAWIDLPNTPVSRTELKTVNGQSIVGAGNVNIVSDSATTEDLKKTLNQIQSSSINTVDSISNVVGNKVIALQATFNSQGVILSGDTTISTIWDGGGKVLRFNGKKVRGTGTFSNWIIDAPLTADIFDTSITLINCKSYNNIFSCAWYGTKPSNPDNWWNIQKGINYCVGGIIPNLFLPKGIYHYSKPLEIQSIYQGAYVGVTLHFYGESQFNGSDFGSTLAYDSYYDVALNLYVNKGSEIDHLNITGQWRSPVTADSIYYQTLYSNFNDVSGFNCNEWYYGIAVDWPNQTNSFNRKGSTGIKIHDVTISGFTKLIAISQGFTQNGELITIENFAAGDCKVAFASGQAQEKGNWIKNIKAWGRIHTVFQIGRSGNQASAGDWHIEGGNIDGAVRVFDINASAWYSTHVNGLYSENIGLIGDIFSAVPIPINDCVFHFRQATGLPSPRIVLYSSGALVKFSDCLIRYYGTDNEIWVRGMPTFVNTVTSGAILNK